MKRNNKKGFTIVELVIVIAVIAILSAVLIPTFGGITEKAKNSARDQEAKNAFTNYLIDCDADPAEDSYILVKDDNKSYYYVITADSQIDLDTEVEELPSGKACVWCNNHTDAENDTTAEKEHNELCNNCGAKIECVDKDCDHNKQ